MSQTYVAPTGSIASQIAIIGEAPGRHELLEGKSFVGASGKLLDALLREAGWSRSETYCTNVIKTNAPRSPLANMNLLELERWRAVLEAELQQSCANIYIALGATALWALTGESNITNWRGSLMQYQLGSWTEPRKLVPTFHPAYLLRSPEETFKVQSDMAFAIRESASPLASPVDEKYYTYPSLDEALSFIAHAQSARFAAFDIETASGIVDRYSICFLDAQGAKQTMSIPYIAIEYWTPSEFLAIHKATKRFLASPVVKIGQNISYDIICFNALGAATAEPYEDIMHMYHAIDPRAPKGLAFQSSMFLHRAFWKDWEIAPSFSNVEDKYEYNCKDSDITYDLRKYYYFKYPEAMRFYEKHYKPVLPKLIQMYNEGICQNKPLQLSLAKDYRSKASAIAESIAKHYGVANFNLASPKQLSEFLYDTLKLPVQYHRNAKSQRVPTADDKALLNLFLDTNDHFVLEIRNAKQFLKFASFLDPNGKAAKQKRKTWDDRLRCEYKMTTGTGRLSSAASTATKLGINLQNIPKEVRQTYIPAPGYIFLERDYRQAEAYVIAWDTPDYDLMHRFTLAIAEPESFDFHWHNTEIMMQRSREDCSAVDRQANKSIAYGSYYGMQPRRVQQAILEQSEPLIFIPLDECRKRQEVFIKATQCEMRQARIRQEILDTGMQRSPTGQIVRYHEVIIGDLKYRFGKREYSEVFRSAYSMIPQDVVARFTNAALVEIDNSLREQRKSRLIGS